MLKKKKKKGVGGWEDANLNRQEDFSFSLAHSLSKFHTHSCGILCPPIYLSPKFNRFNQDFATLHLSFLFLKKNSKEDFDIILLFRRFREESRGLYSGDGQRPLSLNTSFRNNIELAFPTKRSLFSIKCV